jgi:hypothetical protein
MMTTSLKIPYVSTSCGDCIFNQSINTGDVIIQYGCGFSENRLERFKENGAKLVEKEDNGQLYYIIEGRLCTACHDHKWGKRYNPKDWKKIVQEKTRIPIDIIIQAKETDEVPDVLKTFESATTQTFKPKNILILAGSNIVELIQSIKDFTNISWRIESLYLKEALKYSKSIYLVIVKAGQVVPSTLLEEINQWINVEMKKFSFIETNNITIIQNIGLTPEEIVDRAKQTNTSYMVKV